jgi:hypothetical protein
MTIQLEVSCPLKAAGMLPFSPPAVRSVSILTACACLLLFALSTSSFPDIFQRFGTLSLKTQTSVSSKNMDWLSFSL